MTTRPGPHESDDAPATGPAHDGGEPVRRRSGTFRVVVAAGIVPVAALAAAGCGGNDDVDSRAAPAGLPSTSVDIEAHEWVLDREDSSLTVDDDSPVTLRVEGDTVSGRAPCNTFRGPFEPSADDSVEIGPVALTRMACPASGAEAEDEFVAALEAVDNAEVEVDEDGGGDADRLVLTGGDRVRLSFRSYDADELLAGTWTITGVATGDSLDSMVVGTEPTITFAEDGELTMETGCNTVGSSWELDGDELTIGPPRTTLMACVEPPGVMEQEDALQLALESAVRVEVAPRALTLLDAEGAIVLDAVRE
jgi:heat shock protein HslJ